MKQIIKFVPNVLFSEDYCVIYNKKGIALALKVYSGM
jgi:hypothetical protein